MSKTQHDKCRNGLDCLQFKAKGGRPAFLIDSSARESGLCAPCREAEGGFSPPLKSESLNQGTVEFEAGDIHGAEMKIVTLDGKRETRDTEFERLPDANFGSPEALEESLNMEVELARHTIGVNAQEKHTLVDELPDEGVRALAGILKDFIPSKTSPTPVAENDVDHEKWGMELRRSIPFFEVTYSAANFMMNWRRFRWADGELGPYEHNLIYEPAKHFKGGAKIRMFSKDAVRVQDYNCSALLTDEEVRKIFGDRSADQVAYEVGCIAGLWNDWPTKLFNGGGSKLLGDEMVGVDKMPPELANSGAHYAMAVAAGLRELGKGEHAGRLAATRHGRNLLRYIEEKVLIEKNFTSEREAADWMLSNPVELDDFLWRPEAIEWINARRASRSGPGEPLGPKEIGRLKDMQSRVMAFTSLVDQKWKAQYEKHGIDALKDRFGHPVGIPTKSLAPHHFLAGGYLVESKWMSLTKGDGSSTPLSISLPVDKDGRPDSSTSAWDAVKPVAKVRDVKTLDGLADLSEACASAAEAWHVMYNRGLPRDSLYMGAALSMIDQNINGTSQDDFSGAVRGLYHPALKGVEMAVGEDSIFFPTSRSKISAIAASLQDGRTCPRGAISLKEIDLANWRLARLSDNLCGNEYGINTVKSGEKEPINFGRLGREYHEKIQSQYREMSESDGLLTFAQQEDDMRRPLVGIQRGEAVRTFVERPGTYLRRTGKGGHTFEGAGQAVLAQIKFPLTPPSAFLDPALGVTTDGSKAATQLPGSLSLYPMSFVSPASGSIFVGDDFKGYKVESFNKFLAIGPGRRGENFPRRLRFAATSLGEKATASGLIDPGIVVEKGKTAGLREVKNIHSHVAEIGLITADTPAYAEELKTAAWHNPSTFALDFELGEMGHVYRQLTKDDGERKVLLQGLLAGKQAVRQALTSPGRKSLNSLMAYFKPVDPRLMYGDLKMTGQMVGSRPSGDSYSSPGFMARDIGVDRGAVVANRPTGSFFAAEVPVAERSNESKFYRKGDSVRALESGFYGTRAGYTATGLEDLPVWHDESNPPVRWAAFLDSWSEAVTAKGLSREFEPYDFEEVRERLGSRFGEMVGLFRKKLAANPHLVPVVVARAAFPHLTRQALDASFLTFLRAEVLSDEVIMRAGQGTEASVRPFLKKDAAGFFAEDAVEWMKIFKDKGLKATLSVVRALRSRKK